MSAHTLLCIIVDKPRESGDGQVRPTRKHLHADEWLGSTLKTIHRAATSPPTVVSTEYAEGKSGSGERDRGRDGDGGHGRGSGGDGNDGGVRPRGGKGGEAEVKGRGGELGRGEGGKQLRGQKKRNRGQRAGEGPRRIKNDSLLKIYMLITVMAVYPLNPCSTLSLGSCSVMTLMRVPLVSRPVYTVIAILLICSSRVYRARFPFCLALIFSGGHWCVCRPSRYGEFVCVSVIVRIVVTDI